MIFVKKFIKFVKKIGIVVLYNRKRSGSLIKVNMINPVYTYQNQTAGVNSPFYNQGFATAQNGFYDMLYNNPYNSPYDASSNTYYEETGNDTVKIAGMAALLQAITMGLQKGSKFLASKLASGKEFTTAENVNSIAQDMVNKNGLNVHVGYIDEANKAAYAARYGNAKEFDIVAKGQNAFYQDGMKIAVAPKSKPSLILHELGHAINAKGTFTRFLQNSRRYLKFLPMALLVADSVTKDPNSKEKSFIEKNAGKLGFCAFLPTIIEEGIASFRGIKAAKAKLGNIPALNILKKNYALALSTYILSGVAVGIAAKQTIVENKLYNR